MEYAQPGRYSVGLAVANPAGQDQLFRTDYICAIDGPPDAIVGLIHSKDVFTALLDGTDCRLRDLAHPIDFVPETMRGHRLLDKFISEKKHLVAVADEYGGFEGIVTLEDVLECLLGSEIVDEHDRHADMQLVARRMAQQQHEAQVPEQGGE